MVAKAIAETIGQNHVYLPCVLPVEFFWSSSEESEEVLSDFRQSHILHHPVRYPLSPASHCRMKLFRYSNYHIRPNQRHFYRLYILTGFNIQLSVLPFINSTSISFEYVVTPSKDKFAPKTSLPTFSVLIQPESL